MEKNFENLLKEIKNYTISNKQELEQYRLKYICKRGISRSLIQLLREAPISEKKDIGYKINELKTIAISKFKELSDLINKKSKERYDFSAPPFIQKGSYHPLSKVSRKLLAIFRKLGFNISDGPEIEDDWHNFTALNIPEDHPARDMQDTFFIKDKIVLRTQTSSVQIRSMKSTTPPIRTVSLGRVYRNEAVSARSNCIFHQIELLYINKNVTFLELKHTINHLICEFFGKNTTTRFRPSFFPFTEPSAEVDVSCMICDRKGCKVCKYSGWVEIGGTGMVDPNVLDNCKIDKNVYSGFAFGMGIERIAMLKYKINDLRLFTENNICFLTQFQCFD